MYADEFSGIKVHQVFIMYGVWYVSTHTHSHTHTFMHALTKGCSSIIGKYIGPSLLP